MESQGDHRVGGAPDDRRARLGLFMLAGIGLLLFVLASAHVCKWNFPPTDDPKQGINWASGRYGGLTATGAWDRDGVTVFARTKGDELCNFSEQTDWDVEHTWHKPESALIDVYGEGGFKQDAGDCLANHVWSWFWQWKWWDVHGRDDSDSAAACLGASGC